jgi:Family of unknown function (DUF5683)
MHKIVLLLLVGVFLCNAGVNAQVKPMVDSPAKTAVVEKKKTKKISIFNLPDTLKQLPPRVATVRSAILPGWGQITNRKYWKLPLVYGALGVTAGIFVYNIKTFKEAKAAYINATDGILTNDFEIPEPYFSVKDQPERIRSFRNQIRQNVDYSALFFLIFWGLNVVDATVDAHLRYFDVGDKLSLQVKPGYSPLAQTNGVSLVLHFGK